MPAQLIYTVNILELLLLLQDNNRGNSILSH